MPGKKLHPLESNGSDHVAYLEDWRQYARRRNGTCSLWLALTGVKTAPRRILCCARRARGRPPASPCDRRGLGSQAVIGQRYWMKSASDREARLVVGEPVGRTHEPYEISG